MRADETADAIQTLKRQVEELNQKIQTLERQHAEEKESATQEKNAVEEKKKTSPVLTAGPDGFNFRSADTNFFVGLHGIVQLDNRSFFPRAVKSSDGFLLRRARPIVSGTVYRDFDFLFVPDFGLSTVVIQDAYLNYKYAPGLQLRAGKFKSPVGLEQLQPDPKTLFNERSLVSALVPNRDLGVELHGDIAEGTASYAAGVFNGVGDARSTSNADFDDNREVAGRIFFQPFKKADLTPLRDFGFGLGGSFTHTAHTNSLPSTTGGSLPGFFTDGQQQFFTYNPATAGGVTPIVVPDGEHWRLSPQAYYYWGPFGLMGEYVISHQRVKRTAAAPFLSKNLENTAWEISGSWVVTGENASYSGVSPKNPFDPRARHWGALQLIARYAELDIDSATFPAFADLSTSASSARAWSAGLNWYLNRNLKLGASFSRTVFSGGGGVGASAPATITRQPENVFFTRLQLSF